MGDAVGKSRVEVAAVEEAVDEPGGKRVASTHTVEDLEPLHLRSDVEATAVVAHGAPVVACRGVGLAQRDRLRGVSTLTAFALTVELGDWNRFPSQSLGSFLGLTPSENSSGERRRQGAITKAGNSHARRLLIEAAWHQRSPTRRSVTFERRREGKPVAVRAQADRSARRLHGRWHARGSRQAPHDRRCRRRARTRRALLGARDDGVAAASTARRGKRTGATTRGATRENTLGIGLDGRA